MPLSEIKRLSLIRNEESQDAGIYQGANHILSSLASSYTGFYEAGLRCSKLESDTVLFYYLNVTVVFDFITSQLAKISVSNLSLLLGNFKEGEENLVASLSAEFFAPVEKYLVLMFLSRGVSLYADECLSKFTVRAIRLQSKVRAPRDGELTADAGRTISSYYNEIGYRKVAIDRLLREKEIYLFGAYQHALRHYKAEESWLSMVWNGWQYPKGLPEGHPILEIIDKFRQIFCKSVAVT